MLTSEQRTLQSTVRAVAARAASPEMVRAWDEESRFPEEIWQALARADLLGVPLPEEHGGQGGGLLDATVVIEALAEHSVASAFAFLITVCFGGLSIAHNGTPEQRSEFLPRIVRGEVRLSGAFTEPGGGSDLFALRTTAVRDGGQFVISGQKTFITAAQVADYLVLLTRTSTAEKPSQGLTIFLVPTAAPGVDIRPLQPLGLHATGTNEVFLDGVRVDESCVLGSVDDGWRALVPMLNAERVLAGAWALGNGQAALDHAVAYAKERCAFGRPIGSRQAIQHYIADSAIALESARQLVYEAARLQDAGHHDAARFSMMAKVAATEAGFAAAHSGMRILAGQGYMMDSPMQRFFRDAHVALLGPSTNEVSRSFIATSMGLPRDRD
ncbi:MAG TPA: acyl-CoA dehydrogenase family protein [Candidatus Dormibacteraeota bacterium]|jgi:alkylation response protein AidB-like acyl-CoA dehydrogenase|nr:acyl-CoA dehydrogenase family protein [Candidatus Dormibacteraeota bacterium]